MMPTTAAKRPPPCIFNETAPLLFVTLVGVELGCVDGAAGVKLVTAALLADVSADALADAVPDVVPDAVVDVTSVVDEVPSAGNEEVTLGLLPEVVERPVSVAPLMVKPGEKL